LETLSSGFNASGKLKTSSAAGVEVEVTTPYGVKLAAGARLNSFSVKSPQSPTGRLGEYFVGIKYPLLRDAGINSKSAAEWQAREGIPLADADFALQRLDTLRAAGEAYWDWYSAGMQIAVSEDLLRLARVRAKAVADRAEAGDLPKIDVVEANQEVVRREGNLLKAEREFQKAQYKLAVYLWEANGDPTALMDRSRLPTQTGRPNPPAENAAELGKRSALERRPELRIIERARNIAKIELKLAQNDRKPRLDLVWNPGVDTGAASVGHTFKLGVMASIPLATRDADGRADQEWLKLDKLSQEERLLRQRLSVEVDDAVSAVQAAFDRYDAAVKEATLAAQMEQAERTRFENGDSTLFLMNQRERARAEAATKVIDLQAEYERAMLAYRTVSGLL
jgi:outer membrane protein TolC